MHALGLATTVVSPLATRELGRNYCGHEHAVTSPERSAFQPRRAYPARRTPMGVPHLGGKRRHAGVAASLLRRARTPRCASRHADRRLRRGRVRRPAPLRAKPPGGIGHHGSGNAPRDPQATRGVGAVTARRRARQGRRRTCGPRRSVEGHVQRRRDPARVVVVDRPLDASNARAIRRCGARRAVRTTTSSLPASRQDATGAPRRDGTRRRP